MRAVGCSSQPFPMRPELSEMRCSEHPRSEVIWRQTYKPKAPCNSLRSFGAGLVEVGFLEGIRLRVAVRVEWLVFLLSTLPFSSMLSLHNNKPAAVHSSASGGERAFSIKDEIVRSPIFYSFLQHSRRLCDEPYNLHQPATPLALQRNHPIDTYNQLS